MVRRHHIPRLARSAVVKGVEALPRRISRTAFILLLVDAAQHDRDVHAVCLVALAVFGGAGEAGAAGEVPHSVMVC